MSEFTREQLETLIECRKTSPHYCNTDPADLAAFALAQVERVEDLERTLSTAIKNHLCEVDKRKQAETISAGNLARAEKAEAERDDANDERDDAVDRWARRAREAEATCKELLQVQDDRDRLRAQLDSILANSESLESGKLTDAHAENKRLREELAEAEEAIRILTSLPQAKPITGEAVECVACGQRKAPIGRDAPSMLYLCDQECPGYKEDPRPGFLWPGETLEDFGYPQEAATADGKLRVALQHPAVRRARERAK